MNTIPNLAPTVNAHPISLEEVKTFVEENDFVWIEFRKSPFSVDGLEIMEDEAFHLRVSMKGNYNLYVAFPASSIKCPYSQYNITWRIWNICPAEKKWEW